MDAKSFDRLVRLLSTSRGLSVTRSRRSLAMALGLFGLLGAPGAQAKGKKGGGKKGGGKKSGGKGKGKKNPPQGIGECIHFGLHSGCRNVPGAPCCHNQECKVCSPTDNCGCASDQRCCDGACKKGNCCTDADCANSPLKFCSKGSTENVCM